MTIDPQNRARFEALGIAGLRADMVTRDYIKDAKTLNQAHEWLGEQQARKDRRETLRYLLVIILAGVAAVAVCIAAWLALNRRNDSR